jgi:NTE family protein
MRRGLVLGGGGVLGLTWSTATLWRLEQETGWDPRTADRIVGTSAGSILATFVASGQPTADLLARQRAQAAEPPPSKAARSERPPRSRRPAAPLLALRARQIGALTAFSGLLPRGVVDASHLDVLVDRFVTPGAWAPHPATWVVAAELRTGARVVLGGPDEPACALRDAVRASCAIPGWFPPVTIGGRELIDGGVCSATSADLCADLDEVIIVSPLTSRPAAWPRSRAELAERALRRAWTRRLDAEVATLTRAGVVVRRFEPDDRALAALGPNLMDPRRRGAVLDAVLG